MVRRLVAAAGVAGLLAATGCTGEWPSRLAVGSSADRYPSERLADWVSYADHVASFTVLDERELPWGEHEKTHREGMVDREVTLRFDRTLWSSPGVPAPVALPDELVTFASGWTLHENRKTRFAVGGGPRLEVGHRYVAAWVHGPDYGWEVQAGSTLLEVDESGVALRDPLHGASPFAEAINTFVGKSTEEIQRILAAAEPDPVAARYFELRPEQRYKLVVLETDLPDRPGFLKAANVEGNIYRDGSVGYVREEDWAALVAAGDPTAEISMFDREGAGLGPKITLGDLVLGPDGLTTGLAEETTGQ